MPGYRSCKLTSSGQYQNSIGLNAKILLIRIEEEPSRFMYVNSSDALTTPPSYWRDLCSVPESRTLVVLPNNGGTPFTISRKSGGRGVESHDLGDQILERNGFTPSLQTLGYLPIVSAISLISRKAGKE